MVAPRRWIANVLLSAIPRVIDAEKGHPLRCMWHAPNLGYPLIAVPVRLLGQIERLALLPLLENLTRKSEKFTFVQALVDA